MKIEEIKILLKPVIDWYLEYKEKEKAGEVDGSYIYDCLPEQFEQLSRGNLLKLIEFIVSL